MDPPSQLRPQHKPHVRALFFPRSSPDRHSTNSHHASTLLHKLLYENESFGHFKYSQCTIARGIRSPVPGNLSSSTFRAISSTREITRWRDEGNSNSQRFCTLSAVEHWAKRQEILLRGCYFGGWQRQLPRGSRIGCLTRAVSFRFGGGRWRLLRWSRAVWLRCIFEAAAPSHHRDHPG